MHAMLLLALIQLSTVKVNEQYAGYDQQQVQKNSDYDLCSIRQGTIIFHNHASV
jgi:hypothetical protein